jgi:predicted metalloenzyme YecM
MIPLNIFETERLQLANILGCKLSSLSITHLGVPLHFKKLQKEHWNFLLEKIDKKNIRLERKIIVYWW